MEMETKNYEKRKRNKRQKNLKWKLIL